MGFRNLLATGKWSVTPEPKVVKVKEPTAYISTQTFSVPYTAEKNVGDLGPVKIYTPMYQILRDRSWQIYLDSDLMQTVIKRHLVWNIKNGLRLQLAPNKDVLNMFGIDPDIDKITNEVEALFSLWANDKMSGHNKEKSFNQLQSIAEKSAIVGGDVLNVMRYDNGRVYFQVIDGCHLLANTVVKKLGNGNFMKDSIEFNSKGEHVAYHVRTAFNKTEIIQAYDPSTGLRQAWMQYGSEYRIDNMRGIPIIATAISKITKIDRYTDATVEQAEQIKQLVSYIKHNVNATGENPFAQELGEVFGNDISDPDAVKYYESGEKIANKVAARTGGEWLNLPPGADIGTTENKNELYFESFHGALADGVASLMNMPPNVAWSKYNDSFSASRAATKDFENSMSYNRKNFDDVTLDYAFTYWLYWECWSGRIQMPGFISSFERKDDDPKANYIFRAYVKHRFVGPGFPHIDPEKEAKAVRLKLGTAADHIPIGNLQDYTEDLQAGDYESNIERFAREKQKAEDLGVVKEEETSDQPSED